MVFTQTAAGFILRCYVLPKSSKTQIVGVYGVPERLKIKLSAPPVDGQANEALIAYLSKYFKLSKNSFEIISGTSSKTKDILLKTDDERQKIDIALKMSYISRV